MNRQRLRESKKAWITFAGIAAVIVLALLKAPGEAYTAVGLLVSAALAAFGAKETAEQWRAPPAKGGLEAG
jgi:hypothetical protein